MTLRLKDPAGQRECTFHIRMAPHAWKFPRTIKITCILLFLLKSKEQRHPSVRQSRVLRITQALCLDLDLKKADSDKMYCEMSVSPLVFLIIPSVWDDVTQKPDTEANLIETFSEKRHQNRDLIHLMISFVHSLRGGISFQGNWTSLNAN